MKKEDQFKNKIINLLKIIYYTEFENIGERLKKLEPHVGKLNHLINYCKEKGFIVEIIDKDKNYLQIQNKGIDFLVNQRKEEKQGILNKTIALTGAIIALSTIYSFLEKLNLIQPWDTTTIVIFSLMFGGFTFIVIFLIKSFLGEI